MNEKTKRYHDYLASCISEHKRSRIDQIIPMRTRHLTLVLEHVTQSHNINAALRSAECFGVQDIYIIETDPSKHYKTHATIARGSYQWLNVHTFSSTKSCIDALRAQNYSIAATSPHIQTTKPQSALDALPIANKCALVFGTEITGISPDIMAEADCFVHIPQYGFTESLNLSVSVALCIYTLMSKLRAEKPFPALSTDEQDALRYQWYKAIVPGAELMEARWLETHGSGQ